MTIETYHRFEKELKRLIKKHPSLLPSLRQLNEELLENPFIGQSLGNGCYKIRMAIPSKGKGKSGGARLITHVHIEGETIYLLSIYDKSEKENISDKEIQKILKDLRDDYQ
jgi:mRNA-degrading endonuclease RelE of RelBE toxin-antitoxin system